MGRSPLVRLLFGPRAHRRVRRGGDRRKPKGCPEGGRKTCPLFLTGGGTSTRPCVRLVTGTEAVRHEKPSLGSARVGSCKSDVQTAPLQGRLAIVEQTQFDQFLFQFFGRRISQRLCYFVHQEIGKLHTGTVEDLSNPRCRE